MSYLPDVYADAVVKLQDAITNAIAKAEVHLTPDEIARELRFAAAEIEEDQ